MSALDPLLTEAIKKLKSVETKSNQYLDRNMSRLFNTYVIPEMKAIATAMNLPKDFVDGIKFRKTGKNKGEVVNTWGGGIYTSSGQFSAPLALWFNNGTAKHWIAPKNPDGVLSWINKGEGRNASAIFFQGGAKEGQRMYSKGHFVSGLPRTEAMETGLERGLKRLKEELPRESEQELKSNG